MSAAAAKRTVLAAVSILALVAVCVVGPAGGASRGKGDRVAPTPPTNPHVTAATASLVHVAWEAALDDVGVAGYYVYGDTGRAIVASPAYVVTSLGCGESSIVALVAFDRAGNRSPRVTATVATAACPDTQPPTIPSGFRQAATTQNAVVLAWNPSADNVGTVGYGIYRNIARIATSSEPTVTLTGLSCGNTYAYAVDATDAAGNRSALASAYVQTAACGDGTPPSAPSNLAVTERTSTSLALSWSSATDDVGVAGYRVSVDGSPVATMTGTTATVSSLVCDLSYSLGVDAFDAAGNRSSATVVTGRTDVCPPSPPPPPTTDATPPSIPAGLTPSNVTQTALTLAWSASTDNVAVTAYDVYRNGAKVATVASTSAPQSGLACGTAYSFGVVARDGAGNASPAAQLNAVTASCSPPPPPPSDTTAPSQPTSLRIATSTATSVSLAWNASTDNIGVAGYRTYRNGVAGATTTQTTAIGSGLTCGTAYTFEVDAYDAAGNRSAKASVVGSTAACADTQPPSAPLNVVAGSRTATSIALSWSASSDNVGVTGYGLYRGGVQVGTSATAGGIFSGLTCNTNYTLAVDAQDAAGNRSQKTTVMVATTGCPDTTPPSTPAGLAATSVTQTGLTLTWTAAADNVGVSGYDIYRNGTKMATVTSTSAAQTGLSCGTAYSFGVVARDAAGNSSSQASLQATTAACSTPPPPPPSPSTWSSPITITQGGTYNGSWESTSSSTPAVRVATTAPVTITGRVRNLAGGTLIDAVGAGAAQVTVDHVFAYGGGSYQTSGRFFQAENFKSVTIRNSTIENTRGIELTGGVAGSSVLITRNRHKNIQGNGVSPVGNFVQFRVVQNATIDVSWNEIVNEYDKSYPEDIISIYHTSNAKVHDNMLWHQSKPGNAYNTSSQGGITLDSSTAGPGCNNNEIARNQVVDGMGIVTYVTQGGNNNVLLDNRVVADQYLPGGQQKGNGSGAPLTIKSGGSNNHAHGNLVGYVDRDGGLTDFNLGGAVEGATSEAANNTTLHPTPITSATEQSEWTFWQQKLAANGITVGT